MVPLGAACFLACALDTLRTDVAAKMPIRRRLHALETEIDGALATARSGDSSPSR